jgi:hypothetical protein
MNTELSNNINNIYSYYTTNISVENSTFFNLYNQICINPFINENYNILNSAINNYENNSDLSSSLYNSLLFSSLSIVTILLWIIVIIIISYSNISPEDLNELIFNNTIIFVLIGIFEVTFFNVVAYNYIPVQPSAMTTELLNLIKYKLSC